MGTRETRPVREPRRSNGSTLTSESGLRRAGIEGLGGGRSHGARGPRRLTPGVTPLGKEAAQTPFSMNLNQRQAAKWEATPLSALEEATRSPPGGCPGARIRGRRPSTSGRQVSAPAALRRGTLPGL